MKHVIVLTLESGNKYALTDKEGCLALVPMIEGEPVLDIWCFNSKEKALEEIDRVKASGEKAKRFFEHMNWEVVAFPDIATMVRGPESIN